MGISCNPAMLFDLQNLIIQEVDLSCLVQPFTREEIDRTVALMPSDKAPGPDDFNGLFIKKCCPIIKEDFYKLFRISLMAPSHLSRSILPS